MTGPLGLPRDYDIPGFRIPINSYRHYTIPINITIPIDITIPINITIPIDITIPINIIIPKYDIKYSQLET